MILALLALVLLSGCASQSPRIDRLEDKVNDNAYRIRALEKRMNVFERGY
jgi:outer membrane murein-binding lipoprotein Lpp